MVSSLGKTILKALGRYPLTQGLAHFPYEFTQHFLASIIRRSKLIDSLYIQQSAQTPRNPGYSDIDFVVKCKRLNVANSYAELAALTKKLRLLNRILPIVDLNSLAIIDDRWIKNGHGQKALYLPHVHPPQEWLTIFGEPLNIAINKEPLTPDVVSLISRHFLHTFKNSCPADERDRQRKKIAKKIEHTFDHELGYDADPVTLFSRILEVLQLHIKARAPYPQPKKATNEFEEKIAQKLSTTLKSDFAVRYKEDILDIWLDFDSAYATHDWQVAANHQVAKDMPIAKVRWHILPWQTQAALWSNSAHYDLSMAALFFPTPKIIEEDTWNRSALRTIINDHARASIQDILHPNKLMGHLRILEKAAGQILKDPPAFSENFSQQEMWHWREKIHNLALETI